jgi:hypothetical protein
MHSTLFSTSFNPGSSFTANDQRFTPICN